MRVDGTSRNKQKGVWTMKRLKLIACKVLYREVCLLSANSESVVDVTYFQQGLHNHPDRLNAALQEEIDRIDAGEDLYSCDPSGGLDFDAILLGYGLCSNAICGIKSNKYKVVVPRAHDCVTLFLGSKEKYKTYFDSRSGGVYWYTGGWIDNLLMPSKDRADAMLKKYSELYDEESAAYLLETEQGWHNQYNACAFVDWPELDNKRYVEYTKQCADYLGWDFELLAGDSKLLADFLSGNWDEENFLVLEPGQSIEMSYDDDIICYK